MQIAANGDKNYGFFASGTAPNYFRGNITCDGLINGAFSLRMESDDPAAFQTTYTTDEVGNPVENQEYIGTTEDLLSIIKDLRARVAVLESRSRNHDEQQWRRILMNNSDLFLVSRNGISHKVRLDTLRSDVNAPVNQEIADLKQKDVDLDRKIDILQLDVNQNEADSDAADAALDARITALEGEPDVDLSGYATKQQLNNEEAARIAGDNSLDTKITTEANARIAGDNTLGNEIDGVEQRVDTLEGKVDALEAGGGVDLTSYATKTYSDNGDNAVRNEFKAADDDLRSDVVAERAARIAGDSNLQSIIDNTVVRTSGAQTITTAPGESVRFNSAGTNGQPRIQLIRDSGFDYSIQNAQGDLEITRGNVDIYRFAGGDHVWYDLNSDEVMRVGDGDTTITGNLTVTGTINGSSGISGDTVYINVKDFGAVGNGTTDDTTAVRNAINSATNGETIYFPKGKYMISDTLTFQNKGFRMLGDSQQSILYFRGSVNEKLLYLAFNDRKHFLDH